MDVFAIRDNLISEYRAFSRSFTKIRAHDIEEAVDAHYDKGHFWPDPLIQLNPNFVRGDSIDELVANGTLHEQCGDIFRIKFSDGRPSRPLVLHKHQSEAIEVAKRDESYVLTTGTGSGKSLSYFIPIVDDVLRHKRDRDTSRRITAIVVYPMNALCNSQREELEKYLTLGFGAGKEPVTFSRYTGQESDIERERIARNPPDILLTNYMMLELIMTRFLELDKAIRQHARGLRFLVLDELHTYRGRQGADVSMLVRRVRERFNENLLCVGTSATMASEGSGDERDIAVAHVASQLFGATVSPSNVITETLEPIAGMVPDDAARLASAIEAGVPEQPTHEVLSNHPVSAWVEQNLGFESQNGKLARISQPLSVIEAATKLSADSGLPSEVCRNFLTTFLLAAYESRNDQDRSFFAFRIHQFISGAWNAYATLEAPEERHLTLEGQQFKPGDRKRRLFTLCFCRECGQEYYPVWARSEDSQTVSFDPRELSERSSDETDVSFGFLMPDHIGEFDPERFEDNYPEEWLEFVKGKTQLKRHYRQYRPRSFLVNTMGRVASEGLRSWFILKSFRFCLNPRCKARYSGATRSDLSKLSGLSSEGRSSATTVLTLFALRNLLHTDLDQQAKKILAFTDNRQDASLQAGHFNDFIHVLLLRGALLAAIQRSPDGCLTDDVLTHRALEQLHLDPTDYAASPEAKGIKAQNALKALRDVLGYRLYFDLQRGWRITSPNLEQLKILEIRYRDLEECCCDEKEWQNGHALLGSISPGKRLGIVRDLLDRMRKGLCIKTVYLDANFQEQLRNRSFNELREPWGLSEDERPYSYAYMVPRPSTKDDWIVNISHRSAFGRHLKSAALWGQDNPAYPAKFDESEYNDVIDDILRVLETYGYVVSTKLDDGQTGYQISASIIEWGLSESESDDAQTTTNRFFRELYANVANLLANEDRFLHQLEAREHTAQVVAEIRQEREERFRRGLEPAIITNQQPEPAGLPILFCSPTMELGVDISTLNTVYLRNVPPTPANYAQRSGRAGRSGQPALVITYCAARSPHDQYFFSQPTRMVAGAVNPPSIDLANEDLVRSHLQAVWLAETGVHLGSTVYKLLDRGVPDQLPVIAEISEEISRVEVANQAVLRAERILATLKRELSNHAAPWYTETWLKGVVGSAVRRFDSAFNRWRNLYRATSRQMIVANNIIKNAAATDRERTAAKLRYDEAYTQQKLLLENRSKTNSDFYPYRYLASDGFLPGYNFPRLPLMAFIPGRHEKAVRDQFLSRPRFLGLTEFGPQSIIYHEGSTYRVRRANITPVDDMTVTGTAKLPVQAARICSACGYGHFGSENDSERCINCDAVLDGGRTISNLYRIKEVSTRRAHRITSDEEERQRQGYEMVTTLEFGKENGRLRSDQVALREGGETLFELKYGPAATLWRINLGWRRRKEKSIYGFSVDANTGEWTKDDQAPTDAEDDKVQEGKNVQRITPYVEDVRNALLLRPEIEVSTEAMVALQYALKRGIEQEFQLEDAELAAEPLPDRNRRHAILFYEASEGGAGVLTRLATDPDGIRRISRRALEICHYSSKSGNWGGGGLDDLHNEDSACEAGCYRCLLSYYNQPEHSRIDRKDDNFLELLCRLTRVKRKAIQDNPEHSDRFKELKATSLSSLEREWLDFVEVNGYRPPDRAQFLLEGLETRPDFLYETSQVLIYIDGPHHDRPVRTVADAEITKRLEDAGYTVIRFRTDRSDWNRIVKDFAWVFGSGETQAD